MMYHITFHEDIRNYKGKEDAILVDLKQHNIGQLLWKTAYALHFVMEPDGRKSEDQLFDYMELIHGDKQPRPLQVLNFQKYIDEDPVMAIEYISMITAVGVEYYFLDTFWSVGIKL